ncbi:MAG: GNAT family N-acetyltransferase [Chloroflexota bacterium]|nr:GNAT family N-acetyltransferase [Chloroflexota bacterium]
MFSKVFPWSRQNESQSVMSEDVLIKGQKVILREKNVEDAEDDYRWRTDEELAKLDATRPINMSFSDFRSYIEEEIRSPSPRSKRLAIDTTDGKHIGNFMYYDVDLRRGEAELGIMIGDRSYWGKGYGRDAIRAVRDYLFSQTTIKRLYLHTLEWNERARKSFIKAGLREVKLVSRGGMKFVLMETLRSEWGMESRNSSNDSS